MSAPAVERPACWDLVEAAQAGDVEAFGQLWQLYEREVFLFLSRRMSCRQDAEDMTSETFARALRRIRSVSYIGRDVGAWFRVIARNIHLDWLKSSRRRLELLREEMSDADLGPGGDVESAVQESELAATVAGWVGELIADHQQVIELRFYRGMTVTEVASVMGRSESAVKGLQHRACRNLAGLVDREAV